jgi:hypothetical protein
MTTVKPSDLLRIMREKFPGMEYYWVSAEYKFNEPKHAQHKDHAGFVYCGYIDSCFCPCSVRVFRSVTHNGLLRLISAEDPNYVTDLDAIPIYQRRLQNYPPKGKQ